MTAITQNTTARAPEPETEDARQAREQLIDEELDESFPASDPPSWVQGTAPLPH